MPQSLTLTAYIVKLLLRSKLSGVPVSSTLVVSMNFALWEFLIFPAWVFVISVAVLVQDFRGDRQHQEAVEGKI